MICLGLVLLVFIGALPSTGVAEPLGNVSGYVLDETGSPMAGALVHASEVSSTGHAAAIRFYETDSAGHFSIENLPWGTYRVLAGKQDDGYPILPSKFDDFDSFPTVSIDPASPSATVTIRLPHRSGAIASISVVDATTGRAIGSAAVRLVRRAGGPDAFIYTSTTTKPILIPPSTDVLAQITAPGYRTWPAGGSAGEEGVLRLAPEQVIRLEVSLAPEGSSMQSSAVVSPSVLPPPPKPVRYPGSTVLSKAVDSFSVTASDISVPLRRLADGYGVPVGFESLPRAAGNVRPVSVRIDIKAGTVLDVLDAIVAADPRYMWKELDGVENVFPKDHNGSLPDVVVGRFSLKDVYWRQALEELLETPEVQHWIEGAGVTRRQPTAAGATLANAGETIYSLTLTNRLVREMLNDLLKFSGSHYWTYYRYGEHGQFFTITMAD